MLPDCFWVGPKYVLAFMFCCSALKAVRDELCTAYSLEDVSTITVDISNVEQLSRMVQDTRVVLTTAGPLSLT